MSSFRLSESRTAAVELPVSRAAREPSVAGGSSSERSAELQPPGSGVQADEANRRLREHAERLEHVLDASSDLRGATSREELVRRVLHALAGLAGFGLAAMGLHDEEQGVTEVWGVACLPGGRPVDLGHRTLLLDLLELSPHRRRLGSSYVVEGWSVSVEADRGPLSGLEAGRGEWDLSEIFDGSAVALTPLQGAGRPHGFLLVKAAARDEAIDPSALRTVEVLARLAAASLDHLRVQEVERRRARLSQSVARLGRRLLSVREVEQVLDLGVAALREALDGACVSAERVDGPAARAAADAELLSAPRCLKSPPGHHAQPLAVAPVAVQLVIPVRAGGRTCAIVRASSPVASAFDDVEMALLELYGKIVGRACSTAAAFAHEQRSLAQLRVLCTVGRIAGGSLDPEAILERSLGELCRHGAFELVAVGLVDVARQRLVLRAQACRGSARLLDGLSTPLDAGVTGWVATHGRPLLVNDVTRDERYVPVHPSVGSELCVPLRVLGETIGVLDVEATSPHAFDEVDSELAQAVADQLARALHDARLYQQVKRANARLQESERKKTDFLAGVAHDLRTPLTAIRSSADVVLMYRDEPAEVREEFLRAIRDESARLGRLVDDFLTHARLEAGVRDFRVEPFDLAEVLRHFVRVHSEPASRRGVSVSCDVPAGLPLALGDRERVEQVVANLLGNAIKFTPDGGDVAVSVVQRPAEPGQVLGELEVGVADTGPGIEEQHREKVFDRYVRLGGNDGSGAGLGLPIARAIVEHLGGRLRAGESPGGGALFCFTLPTLLSPEHVGGGLVAG